jgi:hypothetical protein
MLKQVTDKVTSVRGKGKQINEYVLMVTAE